MAGIHYVTDEEGRKVARQIGLQRGCGREESLTARQIYNGLTPKLDVEAHHGARHAQEQLPVAFRAH